MPVRGARLGAAGIRMGLLLALALSVQGRSQEKRPDAATSVPEQLTLRECFRLTLKNNTAIQAARYQADAEQARITAAEGEFDTYFLADAGWILREEPLATVPEDSLRTAEGAFSAGFAKRFETGSELELATSMDYTDDRDDLTPYDPLAQTGVGVVVRQDILRNRGLLINRTDIMVAYDTWMMAMESLRNEMIQNLFQVESAYWALYFAREDLRVREQQLARARRLVEVAESQVRVGEGAPLDVTRAQSSAASQEVSILDARNRIIQLRHRLLRLLGVIGPATVDHPVALLDTPPEPVDAFTLERSLEVAFERRPDCRQAMLALGRAQRRELYAENQILPLLQVYGAMSLAGLDDGVGGSVGDVADASYDSWEVGVRLQVPLGNRTARGNAQAASMVRRRTGVLRQAVLETATREVADAMQDLQTARRQIEAAREFRQLAERLLTAEEKSYRLGRTSSLDLLVAQQGLASAEREVIRAKVAYATALSAMMAVRGDFLEQKDVAETALDPGMPAAGAQ